MPCRREAGGAVGGCWLTNVVSRLVLAIQNGPCRQVLDHFRDGTLEFLTENHSLGTRNVDAMCQSLLHNRRVDHGHFGSNLANGKPGDDELWAIFHK